MKDLRNQCPKFLSAECPNNCHYDDWCKYYKELHKEEFKVRNINVICKGITVNERIKPREECEPKTLKCPQCDSERISALVTVFARACVDVNSGEIVEIIDAEFDDPTSVEEVHCESCDYQWIVDAVVVNGYYEYIARGER
jgi:hypothetical protein